jgi:hypothetical protein
MSSARRRPATATTLLIEVLAVSSIALSMRELPVCYGAARAARARS